MNDTTHTLKADAAGFLITGKPVTPSREELTLLMRLRDEVRFIRDMLVKKAMSDPSDEAPKDGGGRRAVVQPATPRLSTSRSLTKSAAPKDVDSLRSSARPARPILVNVTQSVVTPKRVTPEQTVVDRAMPQRDESGRFVPQEKPVKPVLSRPVVVKVDQTTAGAADGAGAVKSDGKVRDLLGDIKDKIGGAVSGNEEVDPNIKAAQEIAGVAGGALNGIKAMGGALGTIATPMLSGAKSLFKPKPNDAPTPWFKRFFNELRGLRREESVFNRAQLRTLKEIEAKPGEGKGGGFMGMLMTLIGPLIAAIGAAITTGFGLLMKLPGAGLLAKLAAGLMPAALMAKRPITQPTTTGAPAGAPAKTTTGKTPTTIDPKTGLPVPDAAGKPGEPAPKKPGLLARAGNGAKGVLKRVPLLGALFAGVGAGASVYESETSEASRAEKDKTTGKAIGGGSGAIAGMLSAGAAGASLGLLAGPIGAAIGGVVGAVAGGFFGEKAGAIVGETMGGWVTDLRDADVPGMIGRAWSRTTSTMATAWTDTTKWFEKKWDGALSLFGEVWNKAKSVFDDLSLGVTNLLAKFGIDVPAIKKKAADALEAGKQKAKHTVAAVGGAVGAVKDKVVQGATAAVESGKEKAGQAGEALKNSAMGKGAGAIAGVIQSIGETRVFQREDGGIEKRDGGTRAWRNNNPGNMEYGAYAKSQGAVGTDGRFAVFPSYEAGSKAKENLIFGGKNYKDKSLTEAIARYAPPNENNTGRYQAAILASVGGQNKRMADYTPDERTAILKAMEKQEGFKVGKVSMAGGAAMPSTNAAPAITASPATTTVVTAGARAIPQMPSLTVEPPKVPDFQPVTAGLASTMATGKEQRPSVIVVGNKTPVGRDLSNRPLAHIVTGGLSGS